LQEQFPEEEVDEILQNTEAAFEELQRIDETIKSHEALKERSPYKNILNPY
jgi:hypothetical protein